MNRSLVSGSRARIPRRSRVPVPPGAQQLAARVRRARLAGYFADQALFYDQRNELGLDVEAIESDRGQVVLYDDLAALERLRAVEARATREGCRRELEAR